MTKKTKSFNAELDDLISGLDLPSDDEIKEDTRKEKISNSSSGKQKPTGFGEALSASKRGKPLTEKQLAATREAGERRKGKKLSNEHRAKLSAAGMGRILSQETRNKIGAGNKGNKLPPLSKEVLKKRSESLKRSYANGNRVAWQSGKKLTEEHRAAISLSSKGRKLSEDHRAAISQAKKGKSYGGNLKPVATPYGVFDSIKSAGIFEEPIIGKKFNPNRYTALLKNPDSGYYRITQEEYERLTKQ